MVFGVPCPWLRYVDNIAIELHDRECEAVFAKAIAGAGFAVSKWKCADLTVCTQLAASA